MPALTQDVCQASIRISEDAASMCHSVAVGRGPPEQEHAWRCRPPEPGALEPASELLPHQVVNVDDSVGAVSRGAPSDRATWARYASRK